MRRGPISVVNDQMMTSYKYILGYLSIPDYTQAKEQHSLTSRAGAYFSCHSRSTGTRGFEATQNSSHGSLSSPHWTHCSAMDRKGAQTCCRTCEVTAYSKTQHGRMMRI